MAFSVNLGKTQSDFRTGYGFKFYSSNLRNDSSTMQDLLRRKYFTPYREDNEYSYPGLMLEHQGAGKLQLQGSNEGSDEETIPEEVTTPEEAVKPEDTKKPNETENQKKEDNGSEDVNVNVGNNNGKTIIIIGDGNTVNIDDIPPAKEGEVGNTSGWIDYLKQEEQTMVCRDDSGRTQNISGKFETKSFNTNPDEFTITDNSSGEDHVYKYKKVGVDDKGRPIYTCVSMNGVEMDSNQYTLVWKEDGTPELVQYSNQDNYGIGLRRKKQPK